MLQHYLIPLFIKSSTIKPRYLCSLVRKVKKWNFYVTVFANGFWKPDKRKKNKITFAFSSNCTTNEYSHAK